MWLTHASKATSGMGELIHELIDENIVKMTFHFTVSFAITVNAENEISFWRYFRQRFFLISYEYVLSMTTSNGEHLINMTILSIQCLHL